MRADSNIAVIIPAFNEAQAIARVLGAVPSWVDQIIVVDNASTDTTAGIAHACGASVVSENQRGYGAACLAGIAALKQPDVVVFLDADFSDDPRRMRQLVDPIVSGSSDLVMGRRLAEHGSLSWPQRIGNRLACRLMRLLWAASFTDLAPFRAIRYPALIALDMQDPGYGWTLEMQIKATLGQLQILEVPLPYRRRIGQSKISGTVRGVLGAGTKILWVILTMALKHGCSRTPDRTHSSGITPPDPIPRR